MPPFTQSLTCPAVTHCVSSPNEWPPEAMKIASKLGGSESNRNQLDTPELFCLALGCSRMLTNHRALESKLPLFPPDPSTSFIFYLLGQLTRELMPECRLFYNTPYSRAAYPCSAADGVGKYFQQHGLADFVATLSLAVENKGSHPTGKSSSISSKDSRTGHSGLRGLHWLAGQEVPVYAVQLPLFFLASKEEMIDMMACTLYHRKACGIGGPVLGITYEPSGTALQAVIGWSEDIREGNATCSQVHIAYSTNVGVFDLAHSSAVRSFTMFLSNHLREVYLTVRNHPIHPEPDSQHWRLDRADGTASHDTIRERITAWLRGVNLKCPDDSLSATTTTTTSTSRSNSRSFSADISMSSVSSQKTTRRVKLAPSTQASSDKTKFVNSLTREDAAKWPLVGITPPSGGASVAASGTLIKKFGEDGKVIEIPRRICSMVDRWACSAAWPPASQREFTLEKLPETFRFLGPHLKGLLGTHAMERDIPMEDGIENKRITVLDNGKLSEDRLAFKLYENFPTKISSGWHDFQDTLSVEQALRDFAGFEAIGELDSREKAFLTMYFSRIIDVSNRARREAEGQGNESEFRQHWDALGALLHYPLDSVDDQVSYRLEQTIPISRNSYFDRLSQVVRQQVQKDPTGVAEEIEDLGASFSSFSTEAHEAEVKAAHAYKTKCPLPTAEPTSSLLRSVPNAATIPSSVYGNLSNSVRQRYKALLPYTLDWRNNWASYTDISARVLDDSDYGVCDACGIVQIPDAFPPDSERESIRKFQISRAPASAHRIATASLKSTHLPALASSSSSSAAAQSPQVAQSVKKETKASAPQVTQQNTTKPGSRARLQTSFNSSHILGNQVPSKYTSATFPVPTGPPSIPLEASPFSSDPFRALLVAFIFWEYKPDGGSFEQGLAQARQDLISAVRHLAAIGIDNIPLFAIVTDGLRGVCLAGWGKPDPDTQDCPVGVYIADYNCPTFDIRDPAQAVRYACFLIRLRFTHTPKIQARFESVKADFQKRWEAKDSGLDWTMDKQKEGSHFKAVKKDYDAQVKEIREIRKEEEREAAALEKEALESIDENAESAHL